MEILENASDAPKRQKIHQKIHLINFKNAVAEAFCTIICTCRAALPPVNIKRSFCLKPSNILLSTAAPAAAHAPTALHNDPKCPELQRRPWKPEADLYSVDTMLVFYFLRLKQTALDK